MAYKRVYKLYIVSYHKYVYVYVYTERETLTQKSETLEQQ